MNYPAALSTPAEARALVLSGGGAGGAYEVGVMSALFTGQVAEGRFGVFDPGQLAGVSVGAINAALILSSPADNLADAVTQLEYLYLNVLAGDAGICRPPVLHPRLDPTWILSSSCLSRPSLPLQMALRDSLGFASAAYAHLKQFLGSDQSFQQFVTGLFDVSALVDTTGIEDFVAAYLDVARIRDGNRKLTIQATDWGQGAGLVYTEADITPENALRIVTGSASLPVIFPPVTMGSLLLADGGIVLNTPLSPVIRRGATEIHVIYVDPLIRQIPISPAPGTMETAYRALSIALATMVRQDIEIAGKINAGLRARFSNTSASREGVLVTGSEVHRRDAADPTGYRPLTIHRYYPPGDTQGFARWFDFEKSDIKQTIRQGFDDAVAHDCSKNQCILPEAEAA